jgi:hypothetical protein
MFVLVVASTMVSAVTAQDEYSGGYAVRQYVGRLEVAEFPQTIGAVAKFNLLADYVTYSAVRGVSTPPFIQSTGCSTVLYSSTRSRILPQWVHDGSSLRLHPHRCVPCIPSA